MCTFYDDNPLAAALCSKGLKKQGRRCGLKSFGSR